MRLLKNHLIYLTVILAMPGALWAQFCDILPSASDTVSVVPSSGQPGTVVNVPIHIGNVNGIAALQAYLAFDSTLIKPIVIGVDTAIDTTAIVDTSVTPWDTTGYIIDTATNTFYDIDTTGGRVDLHPEAGMPAALLASQEVDFPSADPDSGRIRLILVPSLANPRTAIDSGSGTAFFVPFEIDAAATHNTVTTINFYVEPILDDQFPPNEIGCQYSRYGDSTGIIDRRFTVVAGTVLVDTSAAAGLPVINFFTASDSTINPGESVTLSWSVTDATSVTLTGVGSVGASGSTVVTPSTTTVYTLVATNAQGTRQQSITIVVSGTNNPPTVSPVPGSPFTIDQGETVTFTVTATDPDAGDIITLTAISKPANSTFTDAVGTGSVSSNFSFTPDFTQSGAFTATFQASDDKGGVSSALTVIINVRKILKDRLFTTSAEGQQPVGGIAGNPAVYLPINLITSQTVYGVQFDFFYDPVYFDVDSFVVTGRTENYVVYDNIGATLGHVRVITFGLANEPIVNILDTTAILYAVMSIDSNAVPGDYPIMIDSGWESVNPDPNYPSMELEVDSGIIQVDRLGDVNLDQRIDVADVVSIVAHIINNFTLNPRQFDAGDVIINDTVDVFDLVGVINLIYGLPVSPTPIQYSEDEIATVALDYRDLSPGDNDMMVVRSELPVEIAAVEMEIDYDPTSVTLGAPELGSEAGQLTLRYSDDGGGKLKVLLHFTNPYRPEQLIPEGDARLVIVPISATKQVVSGDRHQLRITKALLSTASAASVAVEGVDPGEPSLPETFTLSQNYPNPFNPTTTIDFSIATSQRVRLDIYNILGQLVRVLIDDLRPAGAYSEQWDASDDHGQRVATGMYLYRLQVGEEAKAKKMVFLK